MRREVSVVILLAGLAMAGWLPVEQTTPGQAAVTFTAEGSGSTVIDITIPGLETGVENVAGEEFLHISLVGELASTGDIGLPALPQIVRNLAVPDNGQVQIEVVSAEYRTIPGVKVYPWQKPLTDHDQFQFVIDRDFYNRDIIYPDEQVSVRLVTTWRGLPFATVVISPVRYNPVRQELIVASRLRVRVTHPGEFRQHRVEPWEVRQAASFIDNLERLNLEAGWNDAPGVRYLVIAHSNYTGGWLDSLVTWHMKRGIETRIIAKSSWTATEIKDSVRAEYQRNNPRTLRWVLLVGEYNEVPGYAYPGIGFSDVWYTDLEPPAGDDYFELGIGRFSPSSVSDLANQIQKTLKFQKNPPTNVWTTKATLVAHSEQYPQKYSACSRGIYHFPYAVYRFTFDTVFGGAGGTNAMVSADINEGRVVVNYRGHGSETDWSSWDNTGQSWTASHINALNNGDMTPVVINCCCLNHVLSTGSCLGESWLRKYPGGAVASVGASEASYTIPNHGWDSTLFRCLGDTYRISVPGVRDYRCPIYDLGGMLATADAHIVKYHASGGGIDNARMYLWLGDPALTVWTGQLLSADVTYPSTVPLGNYDLNVNVARQGSPVRDALVCAWKPGEFYVFGYTDNGGNVLLPICATSPGSFSLTVTGQGFVPHEGSILARTTGTPYVTFLRCVINDSMPRGNGDGCINPGEQIILPTWVKNHGDSVGRSVIGRLRISDPYVTITDSVKSFGNVLPRDSAWTGPNGFGFTVAVGCTNGHVIHFILSCRDALDSVWNSHIYLRVGAPRLVYASQVAADTIAGGNGNGRIDPNEFSQLYVGLQNVGYGHANAVTAVLRSGDARFVILDSTGAWGQIRADSIKLNSGDPFVVHALSMPMETEIPCTLRVSAQGGYTAVVPFSVIVGAIRQVDPIPDGPRTPPLYWAYDDIDTFYTERPNFSWVEIRNLGTRLTLSDDQTITINLPTGFGPWVFYGQAYYQISICSNGWVAPGQTSVTTYNNTQLPNSSMPPMVCLNWDDLYPPAGGGVWYYHDTANHRFIVEYDSVRYYSGSNYDKNQLVIYDTTVTFGDNEFVVQYLTANQTSSATVGMQDTTRTIAIECLFNGSYHRGAAPIVPGRAIKFTTDGPTGIAEPKTVTALVPNRLSLMGVPSLFRDRGVLRWQLPVAGAVRLAVYDVTGREVRMLLDGTRSPGVFENVWDGTDNEGCRVPAGVYLCRLSTAGGEVTVRSVLVR